MKQKLDLLLDAINVKDFTVEDVETVFGTALHSGMREVYVSPYEMYIIVSYARENLTESNDKLKDELLFRGEIGELFGIKITKTYDENKPPEEKKVNEAE